VLGSQKGRGNWVEGIAILLSNCFLPAGKSVFDPLETELLSLPAHFGYLSSRSWYDWLE